MHDSGSIVSVQMCCVFTSRFPRLSVFVESVCCLSGRVLLRFPAGETLFVMVWGRRGHKFSELSSAPRGEACP